MLLVAKGRIICQYLYKCHPLILEFPLSIYAILEKHTTSELSVLSSSQPSETSPSRERFCLLNGMS